MNTNHYQSVFFRHLTARWLASMKMGICGIDFDKEPDDTFSHNLLVKMISKNKNGVSEGNTDLIK